MFFTILLALFGTANQNSVFSYADFVCHVADNVQQIPKLVTAMVIYENVYATHLKKVPSNPFFPKINDIISPLLNHSCTPDDREDLGAYLGYDNIDSPKPSKLIKTLENMNWTRIMNNYDQFQVLFKNLDTFLKVYQQTKQYLPQIIDENVIPRQHIQHFNTVMTNLGDITAFFDMPRSEFLNKACDKLSKRK
ncbi:hypothetical protein RF11_16287 [Thelohanellus kitauei]|uniref:Uncharacterized protein n=1 Tax=Thelohanellus kitauei TaxID=669202 RepID=A0A0C2MFH0_THEKT|nr:hypothetical protein RF11_16287 [Thelohanellus kitauei]